MSKGIVIYYKWKDQFVTVLLGHIIPHSGPLRSALIEHLSCNRPPVVFTIFFFGHNCCQGRRKPLNTPYLLHFWWLKSQIDYTNSSLESKINVSIPNKYSNNEYQLNFNLYSQLLDIFPLRYFG